MGGGGSKPRVVSSHTEDASFTPERCIPPVKRYDPQYLTKVLQEEDLLAPMKEGEGEEKMRRALEACDSLQQLSDSYAYSEDAIAAGSLHALLKGAIHGFRIDSSHLSNQVPSERMELPLSCCQTLMYMMESSSAPQLFCQAILPLIAEEKEKYDWSSNPNACSCQEHKRLREWITKIKFIAGCNSL